MPCCTLSLMILPSYLQEIMLHLQDLPTSDWRDSDVELLLAEAYKLSFMFADAPGHLSTKS